MRTGLGLECGLAPMIVPRHNRRAQSGPMNIHHLELFYYVAKHGGISEGVRNMPYGIQQPAMSAQIIQLEESLGLPLFQRRPFLLTAAGQELYDFIRPFFENVNSTADRLRGGVSQQIRIGASEIVLRDYLPAVVQEVRKKFPKLRLMLRAGYHPELCSRLQRQELDLLITILEQKPPAGTRVTRLVSLPLVLLVRRDSKITSAQELWTRDRIDEPLITLPANEPVARNFQQGLSRLGVDWFPSLEVDTLKLVETYAAHGYGIGLTVGIPKVKVKAPLRVLSLENFEPITLGALWNGKPTPIMQAFLNTIECVARSFG
jgi:DNA-binding transcriptional LysR family regulator